MGILQDLTGSSAAKAAEAAARDTYKKQQEAIAGLNSYSDTLPGLYKDISSAYDPYRSAGTDALSMLRSGLGLGGDGAAFTNAFHNLPGYQSGLDTGLTGAQRALNAGNMGQSGRALKSLYRFGSDYEDQRSGDYLSRLMGLSSQGMQATGAATGLEATGLGEQANLRQSAFGGGMQAAGTIGQGMVAGAQARQQGTQGLLNTGAMLAGTAMGMPSTRLPGFGGGMTYPTAASQGAASTWWPAPRVA